MTSTLRARLGAATTVGMAILLLGACSATSTISEANMEKQVTDFVSQNTKAKATNVKCPDNTEAKVGTKVDCTFSAQDGDYVANVEVTKVDGDNVEFFIKTAPK